MLARARKVMATYADMEELIRLGAYRPGSSAEVDEAIGLHPALEAFLGQDKEECTSLAEGYQRLAEILPAPARRAARKAEIIGLDRGHRKIRFLTIAAALETEN